MECLYAKAREWPAGIDHASPGFLSRAFSRWYNGGPAQGARRHFALFSDGGQPSPLKGASDSELAMRFLADGKSLLVGDATGLELALTRMIWPVVTATVEKLPHRNPLQPAVRDHPRPEILCVRLFQILIISVCRE